MSSLAVVRQEWEEGSRRLEAARDDRTRYRELLGLLELALDELRKRVGQTYTLAELADAYPAAEHWVRETLEERAQTSSWPRELAVVVAAAFGAFSRGAVDYEP